MHQRYMEHSELQEMLLSILSRGVEVPSLSTSQTSPKYIGSTLEGVDIYSHAGVELKVSPGEVIDNHGNVVPLDSLVATAINIYDSSIRDSISRKIPDSEKVFSQGIYL